MTLFLLVTAVPIRNTHVPTGWSSRKNVTCCRKNWSTWGNCRMRASGQGEVCWPSTENAGGSGGAERCDTVLSRLIRQQAELSLCWNRVCDRCGAVSIGLWSVLWTRPMWEDMVERLYGTDAELLPWQWREGRASLCVLDMLNFACFVHYFISYSLTSNKPPSSSSSLSLTLFVTVCVGERSEGSRLEAWMKSHKSEVAIIELLHQPGNGVGSPLRWTQAATANNLPLQRYWGKRDAAGPVHKF